MLLSSASVGVLFPCRLGVGSDGSGGHADDNQIFVEILWLVFDSGTYDEDAFPLCKKVVFMPSFMWSRFVRVVLDGRDGFAYALSLNKAPSSFLI